MKKILEKFQKIWDNYTPERFSSLGKIYRPEFVNKPQSTFQDGLKVAMMLAMETVEDLW